VIDVLVVEDSPVLRELLIHILGAEPDLRVVGAATTGEEALALAARLRPHVITMDIHLPIMDGFEATRRIMQQCPAPVVVVSGSSSREETTWAFRAIEAGALAVVHKPVGPQHPDHESMRIELVSKVKLMAQVKVVRRWPRPRPSQVPAISAPPRSRPVEVVAIGASTGGPPVLQTILSDLPAGFSAAVLVVQHMSPGFIEGFADWLAQTCRLPVQLPAHGDLLQPGCIYLAPDGRHMRVSPAGSVLLSEEASQNGLRPSVAELFRSVAEVYGPRAAGVLLTGMGKDGAEELQFMRARGAVTIAQDKESSVVYGMPAEAVRIGAASHVLPPAQIASLLVLLARGATTGSQVLRAKHEE
jgi:two-component system chemotaxis response regulator CheB